MTVLGSFYHDKCPSLSSCPCLSFWVRSGSVWEICMASSLISTSCVHRCWATGCLWNQSLSTVCGSTQHPTLDFPLIQVIWWFTYENIDPDLHYTFGDWQTLVDEGGHITSVATEPGSSVTIMLSGKLLCNMSQKCVIDDCVPGTTVIWHGWTPVGYGRVRSNATYWIDGGKPVRFSLDPIPSAMNSTVHNLRLIGVQGLSSWE